MFHEEDFFDELSGLREAKLSLLIFLVSPAIKSLVLAGVTGTGKSHLCRIAGSLTGEKIVHLPQHATRDRVFGSIDITASITRGEKIVEHGLLKDADGGVLLMDDIQLMDHSLVSSILSAAENGHVVIERDGISSGYHTNFKILATLNPCEGELIPHLIDRFSLYAVCSAITDKEERKLFLKHVFLTNTRGEESNTVLKERKMKQRDAIVEAQNRYRYVHIPDGLMDLIANLGTELGVEGHRGEIAHSYAGCALAALKERDQVIIDDISGTAQIALQHRRRDDQKEQNTPPDGNKNESSSSKSQNESQGEGTQRETQQETQHKESDPEIQQSRDIPQDPVPDQVFEISDLRLPKDLLLGREQKILFSSGITGRKGSNQKRSDSGRYYRSRIPSGQIADIAFDATIRAAAPYQQVRPKGDLALNLLVQDIRVRERKRKSGRTIIFVVDSSGSMGAAKRMKAVKGAVFSILKDAYINRDRVALISFRGHGAEVLLKPTRSGMTAYRQLADLPTGGKTPLSSGIYKTISLIRMIRKKNSHDVPLVIFISDGRANHAASGHDPVSEAWMAAASARNENAQYHVIDTECGYPRLHLAGTLAEKIGGRYTRLDTLNGEEIVHAVRQEMHS